MHINLHKKDELCIKTYFLHKKTSPACVRAEEEFIRGWFIVGYVLPLRLAFGILEICHHKK